MIGVGVLPKVYGSGNLALGFLGLGMQDFEVQNVDVLQVPCQTAQAAQLRWWAALMPRTRWRRSTYLGLPLRTDYSLTKALQGPGPQGLQLFLPQRFSQRLSESPAAPGRSHVGRSISDSRSKTVLAVKMFSVVGQNGPN